MKRALTSVVLVLVLAATVAGFKEMADFDSGGCIEIIHCGEDISEAVAGDMRDAILAELEARDNNQMFVGINDISTYAAEGHTRFLSIDDSIPDIGIDGCGGQITLIELQTPYCPIKEPQICSIAGLEYPFEKTWNPDNDEMEYYLGGEEDPYFFKTGSLADCRTEDETIGDIRISGNDQESLQVAALGLVGLAAAIPAAGPKTTVKDATFQAFLNMEQIYPQDAPVSLTAPKGREFEIEIYPSPISTPTFKFGGTTVTPQSSRMGVIGRVYVFLTSYVSTSPVSFEITSKSEVTEDVVVTKPSSKESQINLESAGGGKVKITQSRDPKHITRSVTREIIVEEARGQLNFVERGDATSGRKESESDRESLGDSSKMAIMHSSIYIAQADSLARSGVAYQLLPSVEFEQPVQLELLHDGREFTEGDGITVYRYPDSEIESDCSYSVLDEITQRVSSIGGLMELDDMKLIFPPDALPESTQMTIRKLELECSELVSEGGEITPPTKPSGPTIPIPSRETQDHSLLLLGLAAVIAFIAFFLLRRKMQ